MWVQHGEIVQEDQEIGGDTQVGMAASVRFKNDDVPGAVITVYCFAEMSGPFTENGQEVMGEGLYLTHHAEFTLCTDIDNVGDTEWWSEYMQDELEDGPFKATEEAESAALAWIKAYKVEDYKYASWAGQQFKHLEG